MQVPRLSGPTRPTREFSEYSYDVLSETTKVAKNTKECNVFLFVTFVSFVVQLTITHHKSQITNHVQYPVHAFPVAGSRTEEWIVARFRRRELRHNHTALIAHRGPGDDARIVCRDDALVLLDGLIHRVHLARIHEHPVVPGAQKFTPMMKGQSNERTGRTGQRIGCECEEVAV